MQVLEKPSSNPASAPAARGLINVTPEEARAELERVVQSPDFPATPRNRRFLSFIVDETLQNNGSGNGRITAHQIATRVFGRSEDFNTMLDPIVRIEAGKLRRDLETYYLKAGKKSALRIEVPRGGYDPLFIRQENTSASSSTSLVPTTGDLAADARAALQRLLESPDFPATERNRRFLAFIVEQELDGQGAEVSAYSVGTRIFGRKEGFDPNHDPIVRIEATKLRRDLETYYLKSGASDPIRIGVPKGAYRPSFSYAAA